MIEKKRILDTARDLIIRQGLRDINLEEITRELGISKKTLYVHFDDKASLLFEVINDNIENMTARIKEIVSKKKNVSDEFIEVAGELIDCGILWRTTTTEDLKQRCPLGYKRYQMFRKEIVELFFYTNFLRGISEGKYDTESNVFLLVEHGMLMLENCQSVLRKQMNNFSGNQIKVHFIQHFLSGIRK